jgi:hypothetical protein
MKSDCPGLAFFIGRQLENQKSVWSEDYADMTLLRLERNLFPFLGNRPIHEVTPPELLAVLQ